VDGSAPAAILDRLTALYPRAIDLSLDRVRGLLADLGDPQDALPPVIHVAGTNGKGSTIAYLRAMLEAAGYAVHVYTSPHLVRFNERIRLAGKLIEDRFLSELLAEVERVNNGRPITFFEVTTAAAFLAFARRRADVVLLETGLGGRLDATNVVRRPAVCAITPISFDHPDFLGDTIAAIAAEKAGIIKPGVPVVVASQPPDAGSILEDAAQRTESPLFRDGVEWRIEALEAGFSYHGKRSLTLPAPALPGRHQLGNAGTAIAVLEQLPGFAVGEAEIATGLSRVEWPARLQRLASGKLAALLPPGAALYLDGGHNESGGAALADWATARGSGGPLDLVLAMRSTKAPAAFLGHLAPHVDRLRALAMSGEGWVDAAALAEIGRWLGIADSKVAPSPAAALTELAAPNRTILICGSLYLAGAILAENDRAPD
jgi:dihydrofolate synthase/folylpolyglutamate synthase